VKIAGVYSFNNGVEAVTHHYPDLLTEVNESIKIVNASKHKTKKSTEKTMMGQMLFSPKSLNKAFKKAFSDREWEAIRVPCTYPTTHYVKDYQARQMNRGAFREMDFVKGKLGIEVQFGKYAFMGMAWT
jgi:Restriction endonuclease BglII